MQKWTILLLCLLGGLCKAQNRLPLLSKSDMYADFDTLYSTLSKVNPHAYVRKTVNHYAMLDSIGALRTQIAHISTPEEFFWLVNKALTFCQDDHSAVLPKRFYPFIDSLDRIRLHFQVSDTSYISAWNQLKRARNKAIQLQLPIRYLNGQYKVLETFTVNGTRILQGAELRTFNDLKIADYLKQHLGDVETLHWDFDRNQWYKDDFYRGNHLAPEAKIRFVFFQEGHRQELRCTLKDSVQIEKPLDAAPKDQDSEPFIRFFEKQGILYIRMPEMSHMEFYLRQLDSIHRQVPVQNISKIIWDIRG
ncbi:MAG: hypothetical protein KGS48_17865, partial [Bacteroidetes bacterium]|nr:hypothetical protein [Bacteroidota bacterium]